MLYTLDHVAQLLDVASEDVADVLRPIVAPLVQTHYYHYVAKPREAGAGGPAGEQRPIHVLLFRTPDDALFFARQVRIPETPRVRPIGAEAVLLHMLAEPRVLRVIFLEEHLEEVPRGLTRQSLGELPGAVVVERAATLGKLLI
ncbi:MAG TPA: hypothetical protein VD886_11645 [Herpetosiphonaceae bacterium]|nr:hypothetical protein [Herpetosiphonaceae bacterium]